MWCGLVRVCIKSLPVLLGLVLVSLNEGQALPRFTALGDLDQSEPEAFDSVFRAMSADGSVLVGYSDRGSSDWAWSWTEEDGLEFLHTGSATSVSPNGEFIGVTWQGFHGMIFGPGYRRTYSDPNGFDLSHLHYLDDDGSAYFSARRIETDEFVRYIKIDLSGNFDEVQSGKTSADGTRLARDIVVEENGEMIGLAVGYEEAGVTHILSNISGREGLFYDRFSDFSEDGTTLVGDSANYYPYGDTDFQATLWRTNGEMVTVPDLAGGSDQDWFAAVNATGTSAVGFVSGPEGREALYWSEETGPVRLLMFLESEGLALPGWTLSQASAISLDGRIIAGNGINPSGGTEPWVLKLDEFAPNQQPIANAGSDVRVTDSEGYGLATVDFDASGSFDPDGEIIDVLWEGLFDGQMQFPVGTHEISLSVTDNRGAFATDTLSITVERNPSTPMPVELSWDAEILPGNSSIRDFGSAISLSDDWVAIGAPSSNSPADSSGAAFLYEAGTGRFVRQLLPDSVDKMDRFGTAIAIHDGEIFVGDDHYRYSETERGAVLVFDPDELYENQVLRPAEGELDEGFGADLAINDQYLVVSAPSADMGAEDAGAVYVFDRQQGSLPRKIGFSDPDPFDRLGNELSLSGSTIMSGAPYADVGDNVPGEAYMVSLETPGVPRLLMPSRLPRFGKFGDGVALTSNYAFVGASGFFRDGALVIFDRGSGEEIVTIIPPSLA